MFIACSFLALAGAAPPLVTCRGHGAARKCWRTMARIRGIAERYGRRRAFVLRYEDLCATPHRVPRALEEWLPGLGAVEKNPSTAI